MIMDVDEARKIFSSAELKVGDQIEAWHNGKLFHRGAVTQTVAGVELFWILDARTGTRRLIDAEALVILRPAGPGQANTPSPPPLRVPDRTPAGSSHIPLFQAPILAG